MAARKRRHITTGPSKRYRIQLRVPGGVWSYLSKTGSGTLNPDNAYEFESLDGAEEFRNQRLHQSRSPLETRISQKP